MTTNKNESLIVIDIMVKQRGTLNIKSVHLAVLNTLCSFDVLHKGHIPCVGPFTGSYFIDIAFMSRAKRT